jgi:RNA polymerase sigma factor (sigma-70 family)
MTGMGTDFVALFEAHYDEIAAYLRRRQVDASTADDLAQAVFYEAWKSRATYDEERGCARAWLFGIAANLLGRHFRAERRRLKAYARAASRNAAPRGDDDVLVDKLDAQRMQGRLANGLAALPRPQLDVLTLHCWAELSHAEIALALEIPVGTVKSRLSHARWIMRQSLALSEV